MVAVAQQIEVFLLGTFCNFFPNIFYQWLVESIDAKPADTEDGPCNIYLISLPR